MSNLLHILIPTVTDRSNELNGLLRWLWSQTKKLPNGVVWIDTYADQKEMTIGEKREKLYQMSKCKYSWQIDDDDIIATNAIELILQAINDADVDCVTFQERCEMNGQIFKSNHSIVYPDWEGDGSRELYDGFHFHRTPFMKSVIKTEIARSVPIPHIRFGEDHQFAQALKPHLKSEIHIPEELYIYQHTSKPEEFNERYGITF